MALKWRYRGVNHLKDYMVLFLNKIFVAAQKGQILLTDGDKKITFSSTPIAIKRGGWDHRSLPAVLIGQARGNYKVLSIAKDLLYVANAENDPIHQQHRTFGGDLYLTLDLQVRATTIEERDRLADVTSLVLCMPDTKNFFGNEDIAIDGAPTIGGERDITNEPAIDHPIYETTISLSVVSGWRVLEDLEERLSEILVDITPEMETSEN